jgi:CheY-like chemotaxis protein
MAESAAPIADGPAGRPAEGPVQRPITVVIADDQQMIRRGLRVILEAEPGISVVAEADDGAQAVGLVRKHLPAVALLDIRMPVLDGLRAARQVIADSPGTRSGSPFPGQETTMTEASSCSSTTASACRPSGLACPVLLGCRLRIRSSPGPEILPVQAHR